MTSIFTTADIDALNCSTLTPQPSWLYHDVTHSQLSLARHSGAVIVHGQRYTYVPSTDELVRDDVLRFVARLGKERRRAEAAARRAQQLTLVG